MGTLHGTERQLLDLVVSQMSSPRPFSPRETFCCDCGEGGPDFLTYLGAGRHICASCKSRRWHRVTRSRRVRAL